MKDITVTTQKELDTLPLSFNEYTRIVICGGTTYNRIIIRRAWDNSSVVAWGNSSVEAWGNSSVEARDNSSVEARDNSSVEAWGNSSVVAWGNSSIKIYSAHCNIKKALQESVIIYIGIKKTENKPQIVKGNATVLYKNAAKYTKEDLTDIYEKNMIDKDTIKLYKSVYPKTLCDFRTGTIKYSIGETVTCPDFDNDKNRECGGGLHLSPTPNLALSFNNGKLLECEVKLKDLIVFHGNIDKVRCKEVKVIKALDNNK